MLLNIASYGEPVVFDIEMHEMSPEGSKIPYIKEKLENTRKNSEGISFDMISEKLEKAEKQRLSASKDYSKINQRWAEKSGSMKKMFEDKTESLRIKFDSKLNLAEGRRSSHL
jgi:hypothetical protein